MTLQQKKKKNQNKVYEDRVITLLKSPSLK